MGYTTSTVHGIEVPNSSEANDVPEDIGKVVTALESGSLVKRLTGAAIAALTAPQKPAGLVVFNTTTQKLQISNGTAFADVDATAATALTTANAALPKAGGHISGILTMGNNIVMGSNRITQLPTGNLAGDAVNKSQLDGVAAAIPKGGRALATFDGSGNAAITHGWGSAPTWAQLTVESPFSVFPHLVSISSTVLNVRASSLSGIITSDSVYMHWLVGV